MRKTLLKENRFSKYLIYALGEIILVVIGILLALQINNWNEERIFRKGNLVYLEKLQGELDLNLERLDFLHHGMNDGNVVAFDACIERCDSALSLISGDINNEGVVWLLEHNGFNSSVFNLQHSVYDELVSNGRLNSLGSDELVKEVQNYYRVITQEQFYINRRNSQVFKLWEECKYGFKMLQVDYQTQGLAAVQECAWIHDPQSTDFLDLKAALFETHRIMSRNRDRLVLQVEGTNALKASIPSFTSTLDSDS